MPSLPQLVFLSPQRVRPFQVQKTVDVSVEHGVLQRDVLANCTSTHVDAIAILEESVQMQRKETTSLKEKKH